MAAKSWLRFRVPLGFLFAFWYLAAARPQTSSWLGVCAVIVALGCALRSWAAGYLFKGKRVAVGGPYAYVRNPLYVGSFIIGVGFCLALWRVPVPISAWLIWLIYLVGFLGIYRAKSLAEEKELEFSLGADYLSYASRVPPFVPTKGHVGGLGEQHFSRELYRRNREYQCILGCIALLVIIFIKGLYGF